MRKFVNCFLLSIITLLNNSCLRDEVDINTEEGWFRIASTYDFRINDIYFLNRDYGFVVGGEGNIVSTINGGHTWVGQNSGVDNDLNAIF